MAERIRKPSASGTMSAVLTRPAWLSKRISTLLVAVFAGLLIAVNLYLVMRSISLIANAEPAVDWTQYVSASQRIGGDDLYAITGSYAYRYSPILALAFGALAPLGTLGWRLLHIGAALALPSWTMRLLALASWPFWYDVQTGNIVIFILLAGAWALRGSRLAVTAFLLLTLLVPRPLMLPLATWLLWKRPSWRKPFVVAAIAQVALVVSFGWAGDWVTTLLYAGNDVLLPSNVGPSRFIGPAWIVLGVPLAAWLTWRGRLGFASLAVSPYWLPYYLLMLLLELVRRPRAVRTDEPLTRLRPLVSDS
jgi:hypothetical protein